MPMRHKSRRAADLISKEVNGLDALIRSIDPPRSVFVNSKLTESLVPRFSKMRLIRRGHQAG